jgi:hypothetical protein
MTAAAWAAVFSGAALLVTLFGVVFLGGKLARSVDDHGDRLDAHDGKFVVVDTTLIDHAKQLAESKGFRDGMKVNQSHGR